MKNGKGDQESSELDMKLFVPDSSNNKLYPSLNVVQLILSLRGAPRTRIFELGVEEGL